MQKRNKTTLFICLIALISMGNIFSPAQADTVDSLSQASSSTNSSLDPWAFVPPADDGAPGYTASGGTRTECNSETVAVLPLLPSHGYGLTSDATPSIFVYMPQSTVDQALFSMKSANEQSYYETYLELPNQAGIFKLPLPEDMLVMDADETYEWSLILMCNGELRPDSPSVQGRVRYVPNQESVAEMAISPLEQAVVYRDQALWYDMLSTLITLRNDDSQDAVIDHAWSTVLEANGLGTVTTAPLIN